MFRWIDCWPISPGRSGWSALPPGAQPRHPQPARCVVAVGRARLFDAGDRGQPNRRIWPARPAVFRIIGQTRTRSFRRHRRARDEGPFAHAWRGLRSSDGTGRARNGRGPLLQASGHRGHRRHGAAKMPGTDKDYLDRMVSPNLSFRTYTDQTDYRERASLDFLGVWNITGTHKSANLKWIWLIR